MQPLSPQLLNKAMSMLFFCSSLLLLLPLAAARDVSRLYSMDFFEADVLAAQQPAEEALLQEVGLAKLQEQIPTVDCNCK